MDYQATSLMHFSLLRVNHIQFARAGGILLLLETWIKCEGPVVSIKPAIAGTVCFNVLGLRPIVLLMRVILRKWTLITGGMTILIEDGNIGRKTCPIAIFSTTNLTWSDPELNPGLLCDTPATNRLSLARPVGKWNHFLWCVKYWLEPLRELDAPITKIDSNSLQESNRCLFGGLGQNRNAVCWFSGKFFVVQAVSASCCHIGLSLFKHLV